MPHISKKRVRIASDQSARAALRAGLAGALVAVPLAVMPWGYNPFGPFKLTVLCVSALLVALGLALDAAARGRVAAAVSRPPGALLAACAGLFVLAALVAEDRRAAFLGSYPGYEGGLLALGAMLVAGFAGVAALEDAGPYLERAMTLALAAVGSAACVQIAAALGGGITNLRAMSTLGNASNLGLWCALALPFALSRAARECDRRLHALAVVACVLGLVALIGSGSRGGMLAGLVGLGVWGFMRASGAAPLSQRTLVVLLLLAAVIAVGVGGLAMTARRASIDGPDTVTGRLVTWDATLRLVVERPFLGFGPGAFGRAFAREGAVTLTDTLGRDRPLEDPHNMVLSTAVAAGPLAAVVLLALAVVLARAAWQARGHAGGPDEAAAAGALAAGVLGLQFHFLTLDTGPALLACVALVAVGSAREMRASIPDESPAPLRGVGDMAGAALAWSLVALTIAASVLAARVVAADVALATGFSRTAEDWPAAVRAFERADACAPWDSAPAWALGRAARDAASAGEPGAAAVGERALARAAHLRPGDHRILRDLADLRAVAVLADPADRRAADAAIDVYDRAAELAPSDPLVLLGRGGVRLAIGEYPRASADLAQAVERAPDLAVGWRNLASAYEALGDDGGAEWALERAKLAEEKRVGGSSGIVSR